MVRDFWDMVGNILSHYYPNFKLGRKEAILGDYKSKGNSVTNTMILLAKQFIWTEKFGRKDLNELHYILFMQKELKLILDTMQFKGEKYTFYAEWSEILEHFAIQ